MADEDYYSGSIAITGHREYPDRATLYRGLDRLNARNYYFGGARGVDTDALQYISRTQPGSIRTVVVPNRVIDQPANARAMISRHSTNVIELRNVGPDRYFIRNKFMVDNTKRTVGFYDYRGRGGTYQTINYARSQGKLLEVNPLVEFNQEEIISRSHDDQLEWIKQMHEFKTNLSSIKMILLLLILKKLQMTVADIAKKLGFPGCNTLEQLWSR